MGRKPMDVKARDRVGLKEKALEELKAFWIIAIYLAVFLGAFTVYRRLVLAELGVTYLNYGFAVIQAMIIAKVILVGRIFGFGRRFEDGPLLVSVIYKSIAFGALVLAFSLLEHVVEGLYHKQDLAGILHDITKLGLYEPLARMLMLIVAFIPFFAFWELGRVLGFRRLAALFLSRKGARSFQPVDD
jgi:hypothetical protein